MIDFIDIGSSITHTAKHLAWVKERFTDGEARQKDFQAMNQTK